jgi:hypothetical protein
VECALTRPALLLVAALTTSACASGVTGSSRDQIIRQILPSTVQLRLGA